MRFYFSRSDLYCGVFCLLTLLLVGCAQPTMPTPGDAVMDTPPPTDNHTVSSTWKDDADIQALNQNRDTTTNSDTDTFVN